MVVAVQYWNEREGKVAVHYFDSEFSGHPQTETLLEKFKRTLWPVDPNKLLQVSMDGPMVKWTRAKWIHMHQRWSIWNDVVCMLCMEAFKMERKKRVGWWEMYFGSCSLTRQHGEMTSMRWQKQNFLWDSVSTEGWKTQQLPSREQKCGRSTSAATRNFQHVKCHHLHPTIQ